MLKKEMFSNLQQNPRTQNKKQNHLENCACAGREVTQDLLGRLIQHDSHFFLDVVSDLSHFLYRFPFWIARASSYYYHDKVLFHNILRGRRILDPH